MNFINNVFDGSFMPHGHCLLWRPDLLIMHVGSDAIIAFSYFSISFALAYFIFRKKHIELNWILTCFCSFIFWCGMTHIFRIINVWNGYYYVEGIVKILTASVSGFTAIYLWPLIPKLVHLPSFKALEELNSNLQQELNIRSLKDNELLKVKKYLEDEVEKRTEELKLAHYQIQLAQNHLTNVMNTVSEGIISVDLTGKILTSNQSASTLFGYDPVDFSKLFISDLLPQNLHERHTQHMMNFFKQPSARRMGVGLELFGMRKNHEMFPLEIGLKPLETSSGLQIIATIVDITERKKITDNIRASEQRYRTIVRSTSDAICTVDKTGNCMESQPSWQRYTDLNENNIQGFGWLNALNSEDRNKVIDSFSHYDMQNPVPTIEIKIWCAQYQRYHAALLQTVPILDLNNQLVEWVCVATDIQAQKDIEFKLREHATLLEESNKDLEQFAHITSHDLKEPVRTIRTFCSYLVKDLENQNKERISQDIQFITEASARVTKQIDDLLELSRVGNSQYEYKVFSLQECLNNVKDQLKILIEESQTIIEVSPNLPNIFGDQSQLTRVFLNLIQNSIKFCKKNAFPVICIYEEASFSSKYVCIAIKDNGIGIDHKYINDIFTPFKKLHSAQKYPGTGMGLAIVKKVIDRHLGNIEAQTIPDEGALFRICLPKNNINHKSEILE